jgi:predicted transposase YdaD
MRRERYLLEADLDPERIEDKLKLLQNPAIRQTAMSLAEKLRQEGRQEGRQQGMQQGMQQAIVTTLEVRLGEVPEGLVEAIRNIADPARLGDLQRAALACADIEQFAANL